MIPSSAVLIPFAKVDRYTSGKKIRFELFGRPLAVVETFCNQLRNLQVGNESVKFDFLK